MNNKMKNTNYQNDQEFVGRLRKAWGRPELSPAEAARFNRALRERVQGGRRIRWIPIASLAAAAAAAVALVVVLPGREQTSPAPVSLVEFLGQAQEIAYGDSLSWEETAPGKETAAAGWPGDYDPEAALDTLLNDEDQTLAFLLAPPEI